MIKVIVQENNVRVPWFVKVAHGYTTKVHMLHTFLYNAVAIMQKRVNRAAGFIDAVNSLGPEVVQKKLTIWNGVQQ